MNTRWLLRGLRSLPSFGSAFLILIVPVGMLNCKESERAATQPTSARASRGDIPRDFYVPPDALDVDFRPPDRTTLPGISVVMYWIEEAFPPSRYLAAAGEYLASAEWLQLILQR
jgi:hypothetical protein